MSALAVAEGSERAISARASIKRLILESYAAAAPDANALGDGHAERATLRMDKGHDYADRHSLRPVSALRRVEDCFGVRT